MATTFFSELLTSITERGRQMLGLGDDSHDQTTLLAGLIVLCDQVLSSRGEASGAALAREVLDRYGKLDQYSQIAFFSALAESFGPDPARLASAVKAWTENPSQDTAADLHFLAEARRQELFRRLNRAPGGTAMLVKMREDLLRAVRANPQLKAVDRDFYHLLASWFNRGFLELRRIDWSSPAAILEKLIRYEAVHQINGWEDLRRRIDPDDRRCYAFFHPALVDEPLIFVEVALTPDMPAAVQPLLAENREPVEPRKARTAVFYSISNCQAGLAGILFGNFLIKQVVEVLRRDLPKLETFVTLSPVPGFIRWLMDSARPNLTEVDQHLLAHLENDKWAEDETLAAKLKPVVEALAAVYFIEARGSNGRARDPVARFHLGNGARLERINWMGDRSAKGLAESAGLMVNYLYDLDRIETNHEAYATQGVIVVGDAVKRQLRSSHKGLAAAVEAAEASGALKRSASTPASKPEVVTPLVAKPEDARFPEPVATAAAAPQGRTV